MKNNFFGKSLVSVSALTAADIQYAFLRTDEMVRIVKERGGDDRLKGKILGTLFYEPSSRTFSSFITSMQRLGGGFIPLNGMANTSVAKGETLEDTAKVFSSYADILVMRNPVSMTAKILSKNATVPVINAGDGTNEHPTQALLDSYTISKHFSDFRTVTVGMVGDLLNGRTVHSLSRVLKTLGVVTFIWVSPKALKMPSSIKEEIGKSGVSILESESLSETIGKMDVIYDTRVQKERFTDLTEYERLKLAYIINPDMMKKAKRDSILMHPLPRVGEITPDVDNDTRAVYMREQMRNGMYMRMALLDLILRA